MRNPIAAAEAASNELTKQGKILDSIDQFYTDDCEFVDIDGNKHSSKAEQRNFLEGFFASLKGFDGATLHSSAVDEDVSFSDWTFKMTTGDGSAIVWTEILSRKWRNGKIVSERYYQGAEHTA